MILGSSPLFLAVLPATRKGELLTIGWFTSSPGQQNGHEEE
jgi:hypothetical protein